MRDALKRIKKYKDKITGFDGLEVYHTGYKHVHYPMLGEFVKKAVTTVECDRLARWLCEENNLDVVECERVHIMLRKCCYERLRTLKECVEAFLECKERFPGWAKCEEIKKVVEEIDPSWVCYMVEAPIIETQFSLTPPEGKVLRIESRMVGSYE